MHICIHTHTHANIGKKMAIDEILAILEIQTQVKHISIHRHAYIHINISILIDTQSYRYNNTHTRTHAQLQDVKAAQEVRALEHYCYASYCFVFKNSLLVR